LDFFIVSLQSWLYFTFLFIRTKFIRIGVDLLSDAVPINLQDVSSTDFKDRILVKFCKEVEGGGEADNEVKGDTFMVLALHISTEVSLTLPPRLSPEEKLMLLDEMSSESSKSQNNTINLLLSKDVVKGDKVKFITQSGQYAEIEMKLSSRAGSTISVSLPPQRGNDTAPTKHTVVTVKLSSGISRGEKITFILPNGKYAQVIAPTDEALGSTIKVKVTKETQAATQRQQSALSSRLQQQSLRS